MNWLLFGLVVTAGVGLVLFLMAMRIPPGED